MMFMRFPIDAVFVTKADPAGVRRVRSVHPSLAAWTGLVPLIRGADGVLELPVGTIAASGTVVGDRVEIVEARRLSAVAGERGSRPRRRAADRGRPSADARRADARGHPNLATYSRGEYQAAVRHVAAPPSRRDERAAESRVRHVLVDGVLGAQRRRSVRLPLAGRVGGKVRTAFRPSIRAPRVSGRVRIDCCVVALASRVDGGVPRSAQALKRPNWAVASPCRRGEAPSPDIR